MFKYTLTLTLLFINFSLYAQDNMEKESSDNLSGQWRTFYMNTVNNGELKDFAALATGGYIKYDYKFSWGLNLGGAFYTSLNTNIQDLTEPDPITGKTSRYEEGLFDLNDLGNRWIGLIGELYLGYKFGHNELKLGRMKLKTPFINPEDGRMLPTLVQGLWYRFNSQKGAVYQLGYINRIAPRSTSKFFNIGGSIGLYPVGRDLAGQPSQYREQISSDFILVANANIPINDKLSVDVWEFFVENVFNSLYFNPKYKLDKKWTLEAEWLHQNHVNNGGNTVDSLSYFLDKTADVIGGKISYKIKEWSSVSLAYDRITKDGRFLFPREWGREFLFSFQKRERSEGTAGNHALVAYYNTRTDIPNLKTRINHIWSVGQNWKESTTDPAMNKYAFPSYTHFNADFFFEFEKLKSFRPELLLTYKIANGDYPDNPNFVINKVDMLHINIILNYNF